MKIIEPCPECGSDDVNPAYDGYWTVECGNCGAVGEAAETSNQAIANWNYRSLREWEICASSGNKWADKQNGGAIPQCQKGKKSWLC